MTPILRLDHVLTFTSVTTVEEQRDRYGAAGFVVSDHIAEWSPGLRNGFVNLWPEYLELLCVDDEDAFAAAPDDLRRARDAVRPYGLGFYCDDTAGLHAAWTDRGVVLPEPEYLRLATTGDDDPPDFCEMALPVLDGADCFVLTSFFPGAAMRRRMQVAPNTVFGCWGVTFVDDDPLAAATRWRRVLATDIGGGAADGLAHGVHRFSWVEPGELTARYGLGTPAGGPRIALVHLPAERPATTAAMMTEAGWAVRKLDHDRSSSTDTPPTASASPWLGGRPMSAAGAAPPCSARTWRSNGSTRPGVDEREGGAARPPTLGPVPPIVMLA